MDEIALAEAAANLDKAEQSYRDACQAEDTARRNQTAALNNLNEAQRAFDGAVGKIKSRAGRNSDWWRAKHERLQAETKQKLDGPPRPARLPDHQPYG